MSAKKRPSDDAGQSKRKKPRLSQPTEENVPTASLLRPDEVDFPRGGGTNLSAVEYKAVKAEALKELRDEIVFKDGKDAKKKKSTTGGKSKATSGKKTADMKPSKDKDGLVRVETLNYKRIAVGMKIMCQVLAVNPYMLLVSLPNQLLGHIPITQISTQFTQTLEAADKAMEENEPENESSSTPDVPDLRDLFQPGQYLRAVVTAMKPPGTTPAIGVGHARDALEKSCQRIELGTAPEFVNEGLAKSDLQTGVTFSGAIKSTEDHGYAIDIGIPDVTGFLPFKSIQETAGDSKRLPTGALVDVVVDKLRPDGRTCVLSAEPSSLRTSIRKDLTSVTSLLPGTLVSTLVVGISPSGLNVRIFGSLTGTLDVYHLPRQPSSYKVGDKLKARILYSVTGTSPIQFSLTACEHILALDVKRRGDEERKAVYEAYPIGTVLSKVTVSRVEAERGLLVDVEKEVQGFVHISHVSDDHVPSLSSSSGHWKIGSVHDARVVGYHPLDGILQISMKPSVLAQKFLRVDDVHAGELMKCTVKKLTPTGLFVSMSGNVDGVIWPIHYADIALKHPQKRFIPGANIKCRVLVVNPERKRVILTAKKTLVESDLPVIPHIDDVATGMVTHGVIVKTLEKSAVVQFYNNIRAIVPAREASDIPSTNLVESLPIGKPVKVRILSVDRALGKITASIRQANSADVAVGDPKMVEIGQAVSGVVSDIHSENIVVLLHPTNVRALISISNLANSRGISDVELRGLLARGETLDDLIVVSRNLDKGIVIVAKQPKNATKQRSGVKLSTVTAGDKVSGRVARYSRQGAIVQFPGQITGSLHPTDACDDFEKGTSVPSIGTAIEAVVLRVDKHKRQLILSTRQSRVGCDQNHVVVDREINDIADLNVDDNVRGFVKSISDKGVFVSLGRDVDARVLIKELFDDFVKEWKGKFELNQLVTGRILSIDKDKKQVEMTLRSNSSPKARANTASFEDFSVGQKVNGTVKKIAEYGLFINVNGTKVSGLCHKSEITDSKDADVAMALRNFREGDPVKAAIISVDVEKRRISFSLKPSHFSAEDLDEENASLNEGESEQDDIEMADGDEDVNDYDSQSESAGSSEGEGMDVDGFLASLSKPTQITPEGPSADAAASLKLRTGFQWTEERLDENDESSSDDGEDENEHEKKKRKRKKEIEQDLTGDLHTKVPESTADFERNLLASPNSSYLWIQYMSFQLQLAEVEKAREIGKRALQTISIREEQEKLNVWIALMNLENTYGSDESLEALFKDAARHNDSKTVHLRLASILDQSQKTEKAEEQYKRTSKKFGQSSKVWTLFGEHYFRRGDLESARKLLPRSLQSLEKRKHIKTISKFAQLEYKLGDAERGRTIFEGIVDSHPKRWDLWQIYIDMEAGQKDIQFVRSLFERVLSLKMTAFKAKAFFKKWLDLERRIGDEAGAQHVKEKAIEWTQQKVSA